MAQGQLYFDYLTRRSSLYLEKECFSLEIFADGYLVFSQYLQYPPTISETITRQMIKYHTPLNFIILAL